MSLTALIPTIIEAAERAAIACYPHIGGGDENQADQAAVDAMRTALNTAPINGVVVIGEGERDEAPMLYIGEQVGTGGIAVDIALDPLEGTTLCASKAPGSITVLAIAEKGCFLHAPDVYMEKIAVGGRNLPADLVDLTKSPAENLSNIATAKNCKVSDLTVTILKRERHQALIAAVRAAGAKVQLIQDGDVMAVVAAALPDSGVDVYMGTGGAPEGVLAAAALQVLGGVMRGRLLWENDAQKARAHTMGITAPDYQYSGSEMAKGPILFAATGITSGNILSGLSKHARGGFVSETLLLNSADHSLRRIITEHN